jgi:hypothetical protein
MKARLDPTPVRIVLLVIFVAGLLALIFGSSGVQVAGLIVAVLAAAVAAGGGMSSSFMADSRITPSGKEVAGGSPTPADPATDYAATNPEPTEADWEREREAYRAKQRDADSDDG